MRAVLLCPWQGSEAALKTLLASKEQPPPSPSVPVVIAQSPQAARPSRHHHHQQQQRQSPQHSGSPVATRRGHRQGSGPADIPDGFHEISLNDDDSLSQVWGRGEGHAM